MDIFKKIFGTASSMMGGGQGDAALGIDIGTSAIKVVEIKKKGGKAMLETYGAISLGPYAEMDMGKVTNLSEEKIAEALKEVLKQSSAMTKSAVVAIPVQSSLIFNIALPPHVNPSEMDQVIRTEARKYIPVPMDEVSLDYFVLPEKEPSFEESNNPDHIEGAKHTEVLSVAIQNEAVNRIRNITTQAEVESSEMEVEIFSSIRANFEHELSPVLLVDFGASRTKLSLIEFGMLKSYHSVNRGGAEITNSIAQSLSIPFAKAEELKKEFGLYDNPIEKDVTHIINTHIDYIFSEINNVLLSHEKKYGRTISKVIFTGGGSLLKGLREVAANNFRSEIIIGHPFNKIGAPEFLKKVLDTTGPEFAVAVGLALRKLQ